jgi:hypothetical protein
MKVTYMQEAFWATNTPVKARFLPVPAVDSNCFVYLSIFHRSTAFEFNKVDAVYC